MTKLPLHIKVKEELKKEIKSELYGKSGDHFITTRNLSKLKKISLVTASKVMVELKEEGLIELINKKYYLTYDLIGKNTQYPKLNDNKKIIGIHVTLFDAFSSSIVKYIEVYAKQKGYHVISASSSYNIDDEKAILNLFRSIGVSGVISAPWKQNLVTNIYENFCLPLIFIGHKPNGICGECVYINHYSAGQNIARHFISLGFQNFAYVGIDVWENANDAKFMGFQDELLKLGFSIKKENIVVAKTDDSYDISNRIKALLIKQKGPLAIFCFHDILALNTIHTCHILGFDVPKQVAVAAFENNYPVALYSAPKITTIGYQVKSIARRSVDLLISLMDSGKKNDVNHIIEPVLTIRESTKIYKERK